MDSPANQFPVVSTTLAAFGAGAKPRDRVSTLSVDTEACEGKLARGGDPSYEHSKMVLNQQEAEASAELGVCNGASALPHRPMLLELQPDEAPNNLRDLRTQSLPVSGCPRPSDHEPFSTLSKFTTSPSEPSLSHDSRQILGKRTHAFSRGSPGSSSLEFPGDASRTAATFKSSWRSQRPNSDPTERDTSQTGSESFGVALASVSSRQSDAINGPFGEDAGSFPPRMPTTRRYSSRQAKNRAIKRIRSWMTIRANSPEPLSNSRMLGSGTATWEDNALDIDESSDESLGPAEVERLWRQLVAKRQQVKQSRRLTAKTRSRLRSLRPQLFKADNAFMSIIRPAALTGSTSRPTSPELLKQSFAELQSVRDEMQNLELDCDEAEQRLGRQESQLAWIEVQFYNMLSKLSDEADFSDTSSDETFEKDLPLELQGISSDLTLNIHPLYSRLEQAVAHFRSWQEEYTELWNTKEACDEEISRVEKLGGFLPPKYNFGSESLKNPELTVSQETLDFLEDFTESEERIEEKLSHSRSEVARLKTLCEDKGVMPEHLHQAVLSTIYPDSPLVDEIDLGDDQTILLEHTKLAHPVFSELLSQPNYLLDESELLIPEVALKNAQSLPDSDLDKAEEVRAAQKEVNIDQLISRRDKLTRSNFVNRWILFSLRISPLDVALLFSIFLRRLRVRNVVRWQHDVLRFWDRDGLTQTMDGHQAYDEQSAYFTKLATPERSRAASDTPEKPPRQHVRASSIGSAVIKASTPRDPP